MADNTYSNISEDQLAEKFEAAKQKADEKGLEISHTEQTDSLTPGKIEIKTLGVSLAYEFDKDKQTLDLSLVKAPAILPKKMVWQQIDKLLDLQAKS